MKHISHGWDTVTKIIIYLFIVNPPNFLLCSAERLSSGIQSHNTRPLMMGNFRFLPLVSQKRTSAADRTEEDAVLVGSRWSIERLHRHVKKESHCLSVRICEIMRESWAWLLSFIIGLETFKLV